MKMNLQYFAEEETNEDVSAEQTHEEKPEAKKQDDKPAAKYTDEDVDKLINKKFATHKSEIEELKAELESVRTKGMSEEEEITYKQKRAEDKLTERIKELEEREKGLSVKEQTITAKSLLADKDIDRKFVHFLVETGEFKTAEDKLEAFIDMYTEDLNAKVEEGVKKALSGQSPKVHTQNTKGLTKEDFKKMTYKERTALYERDKDLYNKLK